MRAEILSKMVVSKSMAASIAGALKAPLEAAVRILEEAIEATESREFGRAAGLATVGAAIAARHYDKRRVESMRLLIAADIIAIKAGRHEEIGHAHAAGLSSFIGNGRSYDYGDECDMTGLGTSRGAQHWISQKIRILRREGYQPKQAAAIAYSMARKKGYQVPKVAGMASHDPYLRTMALLGMMGRA